MWPLILFYLKLILAASCGQGISLVAKHLSMSAKAKTNGVPYKGIMEFLRQDLRSIIGTALTIFLLLLLIGEGTKSDAIVVANRTVTWWIFEISIKAVLNIALLIIMATSGYTGMDIALRLFSVTNSKINKVIDYKTTIADEEIAKRTNH